MMTIAPDALGRKSREAAFFLGHMRSRRGDSRLDRQEEFSFNVSAFLNAVYSVQEVLKKGHQRGWRREWKSWRNAMDVDLRTLVDSLHKERRVVVHLGGNSTSLSTINEPSLHHSPAGMAPWAFEDHATIGVSHFSLELDGRLVPAIAVCERYLAAIENLVARCIDEGLITPNDGSSRSGSDLRGRDAAIRVNQLRSSQTLLKRNYEELLTFLDYLCAPSVAFSYSRVEEKWLWYDGMIEITRLFHNFVAAALSLIDHTRVLYRHLYESANEFPELQPRIEADFVNHPLTQFVVKLRQMTQHYRLPSIENYTSMSNINKDGLVGNMSIQMRLRTDDLRQFDGWNNPATSFLESAGDHIDLRAIITEYYAHVNQFYEWFDQRQRALHGVGPDLFRHLSMHGVASGPRKEIADFEQRITVLEQKDRGTRTFADLDEAFWPVLSIVDARRLMLCKYDTNVWIEAAVAAAQSRFTIPADLLSRIRDLV